MADNAAPITTAPSAPGAPAVSAPAPQANGAGHDTPPKPRQRVKAGPARQLLVALASLRLTVVLFVLSLVLVFFGTLAQIDNGIWTVVNSYFRSFHVWIPFQLLLQFGQVFFAVPPTWKLPGAFPFPGGWLIGTVMLVNLLAAHLVRFKLSWKRSGILLIHAGLIVMMLGELITGLYAVEGNMVIAQGESCNFVQETRHGELAVVDASDPKEERVVVVPDALLRKGGVIDNASLPFKIKVDRYLINSELVDADEDEAPANPATAGRGQYYVAVERKEVSGVSTDQTVEMAAAYVTFLSKADDKPLGTYLVATQLVRPQAVVVDGKSYEVALRPKRVYKPYSLYLEEFRFDRYMGTETPKNFSSKVRLIDPERHEDREVTIKMNDPLRHRGETFYQAGWDRTTEKGTILQVVRNPGWLMPYASCAIVALGMLLHFGLNLVTFLRRGDAA